MVWLIVIEVATPLGGINERPTYLYTGRQVVLHNAFCPSVVASDTGTAAAAGIGAERVVNELKSFEVLF